MRCKFCGSKSLHNDSAHQTFSTGKAVAGAITFGVVGAAAGFIGKERQGYRCGACGAFMDTPMDLLTENLVDSAIRQAELGKSQKMYSYYKSQYPNIQANIPVSGPGTAARTEEIYKELPAPPIQDGKSEENVKYRYRLNVWHPDCPVYIDEIIIKTGKDGDCLSLIAFNQAEAQLRSAYFNVEIFDDTGDKIGETKCVYQNLNLKTGEKLPDNKEFPLNTDIAYRVDIKCEKAAMVGDKVWRDEDLADPVFLTEQAVLEENHFPRLKYVRASLPKYSKLDQSSTLYLPEDHEEYWQCICGHAVIKGKVCPYCGSKGVECLEELLSQKRLEELQQTAVKERAAKRAEITYPLYEKEYNRIMDGIYSKAASLLSADTEPLVREAARIFRSIEEYKDSSERARQCEERIPVLHNDNIYDSAIKLMAEDSTEKYESAIELFQSIPDWKDSKELIDVCREKIEELKQKEEEARLEAERLAEEKRITEEKAKKKRKKTLAIVIPIAVAAFIALIVVTTVIIPNNHYEQAKALLTEGRNIEAAMAFGKLGNYKDAAQISFSLWGDVTKRETISAGAGHTVGLKNDGTVEATGNNIDGQCYVEDWEDIVAISAGRQHTVGLKSNGTVVATGENDYKQCNVTDWMDIIAVSAGDSHTVGLKSDGSVVAVGSNEFGQCDVADWEKIIAVFAGYGHTVGLKSDGSVVAVGSNEFGQCDVADWENIIDVSAAGFYTVGLKSDGTVVATGKSDTGGCETMLWKNVIAVTTGGGFTIGLKNDGTVISTEYIEPVLGYAYHGQCEVSSWKDVLAVSAGNHHTIGLKSDGTVVSTKLINNDYGSIFDIDYGQCNVSGWSDIMLPQQFR